MLRSWCILLVFLILSCGDNSTGPEPKPNPNPVLPNHEAGDRVIDLPGGVKMAFVWIEPGMFMMGGGGYAEFFDYYDELPQHQVTLTKGYYLGKYEVTRGQWTSVMGTDQLPEAGEAAQGQAFPVVNVSWEDCQRFIQRLNQLERQEIYRLPTEAEWEYACRAGTTVAWSYGVDHAHSEYVWYAENSDGRPHAVGLKLPNPWGLYDMHGNVSEWTSDWFSSYSSDPQIDPMGPDNPHIIPYLQRRIIRGGSFLSSDFLPIRSAFRLDLPPSEHSSSVGFRIARTMRDFIKNGD